LRCCDNLAFSLGAAKSSSLIFFDVLLCRYEAAISGFKSCIQSYFALEEEVREPSPSPLNSPKHGSLKRDSGSLAKIALLHKSPDPAMTDTSALSFMVKQVD
jgi:hypothetical protein